MSLQMNRKIAECESKLEKEVAAAHAQGWADALTESSARHAREIAELMAEWEADLEEQRRSAEAQQQQVRESALASIRQQNEAESAALTTQIEQLERALSDKDGELSTEKRACAEATADASSRVQEIEELLTTHQKDIEQMTSELNTSHAEVSALEAEITVLRGELANMRSQLDSEILVARTANEQLDRNRTLLEQAHRSLEDVIRHTTGGSKAPPSGSSS
jgi:chromosome segregation ATPase